ncbi:hypothetical protein ACF08M_12985 [Streptomyces sp. NPDC015032]|uniref:hypothetical protein n=1 Tax=Streptomyces sp. NPDC015032 TaxID=3364937 RepID=UPI0036F5D304
MSESPINLTNPSRPGLRGHQRQGRSREPAGVRVSGEAARYRSSPASSGLPETAEAGHGPRAGRPADAFDAWWIAPGSYRVKTDSEHPGQLLGVDLDVPVLRKRPIRPAAGPELDSLLALARQALGLEDATSSCPHQPDGAPQPRNTAKEND